MERRPAPGPRYPRMLRRRARFWAPCPPLQPAAAPPLSASPPPANPCRTGPRWVPPPPAGRRWNWGRGGPGGAGPERLPPRRDLHGALPVLALRGDPENWGWGGAGGTAEHCQVPFWWSWGGARLAAGVGESPPTQRPAGARTLPGSPRPSTCCTSSSGLPPPHPAFSAPWGGRFPTTSIRKSRGFWREGGRREGMLRSCSAAKWCVMNQPRARAASPPQI